MSPRPFGPQQDSSPRQRLRSDTTGRSPGVVCAGWIGLLLEVAKSLYNFRMLLFQLLARKHTSDGLLDVRSELGIRRALGAVGADRDLQPTAIKVTQEMKITRVIIGLLRVFNAEIPQARECCSLRTQPGRFANPSYLRKKLRKPGVIFLERRNRVVVRERSTDASRNQNTQSHNATQRQESGVCFHPAISVIVPHSKAAP